MRTKNYQNDIMRLKNEGKLSILCWEEEVNGEPSVCSCIDGITIHIIPKDEWKLDTEELMKDYGWEDWKEGDITLSVFYDEQNNPYGYIPAIFTDWTKRAKTRKNRILTFRKIANPNTHKWIHIAMEDVNYFDNPTFRISRLVPMAYMVGVCEGDKLVGVIAQRLCPREQKEV